MWGRWEGCSVLGGSVGQVGGMQGAGRQQGAGVRSAWGWEAAGGRCEECKGLGGGVGQV